MRSEAYAAAERLPYVTQLVNDDNQLATALLQYGGPVFRSQWGFSYGTSERPPDAATDESEPIYSRNSHLGRFPNSNLSYSQIDNHVEVTIMKGFGIPVADIAYSMKSDIVRAMQLSMARPGSGSWDSFRLDHEYGLHQAQERPVKLDGLLIYWSPYSSAEDLTVYLFFFGLAYEMEANSVLQDLKKLLRKNLPQVALERPPVEGHLSNDALQTVIEEYSFSQYTVNCGFDFPNRKAKSLSCWKGTFQFSSFNPNKSDISDHVAMQIFGPDVEIDIEIHHGLQKTIHDWIVDTLNYFSGPYYSKNDNEWYSEPRTAEWPYTANGHNWKLVSYSNWVFANGAMIKNYETARHFYLHLLLTITAEKNNGGMHDIPLPSS